MTVSNKSKCPNYGETAVCVLDCQDKLGEGIFWCPEEQVLYWVDIAMPSILHRFDPASGRHKTWAMPEMICSLAKRRDGTLFIASHHGLNFFDPIGETLTRVVAPEASRPLNRANDGAPDALGRFWYGSMTNNIAADGSDLPIPSPTGVLYRVEPDMRVIPMDGPVGISNGTCFSPDSSTLYFADTMAEKIYAYDLDLESGGIRNKRIFANPSGYGYPDGSTVDAEGYIWNARWEAACVIRFSPDGKIDRVVDIPASRVTCCAFGGKNLDELYVTTSRMNVSPSELEQHPEAGGVFALSPGVCGLPRPTFGG
jgi:sugar lactone lactonase YvrE